jgi:hypothetical protein
MPLERLLRRGLIAIPLVGLFLGSTSWGVVRKRFGSVVLERRHHPGAFRAIRLHDPQPAVRSYGRRFHSSGLDVGRRSDGSGSCEYCCCYHVAGGNLLEDIAVGRPARDLKLLINRAPRVAHRLTASIIEEIPIEQVVVGDNILVKAGEIIPVDGVVTSERAMDRRSGAERGANPGCSSGR